ncbi:hypothetical protein BJ912DRAFT_644575 [Pholiota molesta]|nr:hypothetical protein BJ912DRAFT_644575 [Pholiota molesta]
MHSEACPRPVLRSVYFIFPPRSCLTTTHCHSDAWEHISCASLKLPRTSYPATSHIQSTSPPPQVQRRWKVPVHRQRRRPRIPYVVHIHTPTSNTSRAAYTHYHDECTTNGTGWICMSRGLSGERPTFRSPASSSMGTTARRTQAAGVAWTTPTRLARGRGSQHWCTAAEQRH